MKHQETVLIIDDDTLVRNFVTRTLSPHYQVLSASAGDQGIQMAQASPPDFVLLDVEMPSINGYEVCNRLKQDATLQEIPVIFLSGHGTLHERMLGYEAGGADFIVKPCAPEELLVKLRLLGEIRKQKKQLHQKADHATQTAFTAMRGSSELGLAIQFIESSYDLTSFETIAQRFLDVTGSIGLSCSLLFKTRAGILFFSSKNSLSPLEKELMQTLFDNGKRFIDFGCRTQINYPRVALLVKNMPLDNPEAYGRYKDFLPTMLGSTDAKIKTLDTEQALIEQTRNLTNSFNVVRQTLEQVGETLRGNQLEVLRLLQGMITELDARIPTLGLDNDQEKYLMSRLDQAIESTHVIIEGGAHANNAFKTVCRLLEHLAERQHRLLNSVTEHHSSTEQKNAGQGAPLAGDTELF